MFKSKSHFLALLPLLSILSMSPAHLEKTFTGERSIASEPCKEGEVCKDEPKKEEPVVVKEEPKTETPVVVKEEPKKPQEPVVVKEEPAKPQEPVVVKEEPKKPQEPVVVKEEPAKPQEPVVVKEEPKQDAPVVSRAPSLSPKFDARAAKVDVSKLEKEAEPTLDKFTKKEEAYRVKLTKARKDYIIDLCDKDAVAAQRKLIQELVDGLVGLKEESKVLGEKNLIADKAKVEKEISELQGTLESLLQDEVENELAVLRETVLEQEQRLKEQPKKEEPAVAVKEEPKKDEAPKKSPEEQKICDLEEKNKVLGKQVEDLLAQQKQIMQTMLGMNQMMVQMNQHMQQQPTLPSWLMSGSLMAPMLAYPVLPMQAGGQFVYYPQAFMPQVSAINTGYIGGQQPQFQPQMGQQAMFQGAQGGFQMPQQQNFYQPQFQAQDFQVQPGNGFTGGTGLSFNFGQTPYNMAPIQG